MDSAIQANALVYQVRHKTGLIPVMLSLDNPTHAVSLVMSGDSTTFEDLGIDRVAIVNVQNGDNNRITIRRLATNNIMQNGDTTTAHTAISLLVEQGGLQDLVDAALA